MSPAVSKAQFRWLHTRSAQKALGKPGVKEWESATGSPKELPERVDFTNMKMPLKKKDK